MIFDDFADVPRRRYSVIYADPAWKFRTRSATSAGFSRSPDRHYKTMTIEEIKAMPVRDVAAKDCLLFMWTTSPHLPQALEVVKAWGFRFSTIAFVWAKMLRRYEKAPGLFYDVVSDFHMGTGYTTRANAEFVILARRGSPKKPTATVRQLVVSPRREHSRKPDSVRDAIAAYVAAGSRLEMNARQEFPGWDQWGDEVRKFAPTPPPVRPRRVKVAP